MATGIKKAGAQKRSLQQALAFPSGAWESWKRNPGTIRKYKLPKWRTDKK